MGNMGAQMAGMEHAPNTLEESTTKTISLVSLPISWLPFESD
jgi:hypothetical protein